MEGKEVSGPRSFVRVVLFLCARAVTRAVPQAPNLAGLKNLCPGFMLLSCCWFRRKAVRLTPPAGPCSRASPAGPVAPARLRSPAGRADWCWHGKRSPCSLTTQSITQPCLSHLHRPKSGLPRAQGRLISRDLALQREGGLMTLPRLPVPCCLGAPILALGLEGSWEQGS